MQAQRQSEEWYVDQNEMGGKKAWQVDVGHRAMSISQIVRKSCQRATTPVPQKDHTLTYNDTGSNRR